MTDTSKKDTKNNDNKSKPIVEEGGPKGLEPTRYGVKLPEWEVKGRVSDF
jgi:hypothetical protein